MTGEELAVVTDLSADYSIEDWLQIVGKVCELTDREFSLTRIGQYWTVVFDRYAGSVDCCTGFEKPEEAIKNAIADLMWCQHFASTEGKIITNQEYWDLYHQKLSANPVGNSAS